MSRKDFRCSQQKITRLGEQLYCEGNYDIRFSVTARMNDFCMVREKTNERGEQIIWIL